MPLVTIESWETETRTSKQGNEYECVVFYGTKHGYEDAPDEPWEKPLAPWSDGEWIKEIQSYGVGAKLLIRNEKQGKHWQIVSIEPWGDTKKLPSNEGTPTPESSRVEVTPVFKQSPLANDALYVECMKGVVKLVSSMMDNSVTFKTLIKKTANVDFIKQLTVDLTNEMYKEAKAKEFGSLDPETDQPNLPDMFKPEDADSDDPKDVDIPFE